MITKKNILNLVIGLCLLLDFGFFYLVDIPILHSMTLVGGILIMSFLGLNFIEKGRLVLDTTSKIVFRYIIIMSIIDLCTFIRFRLEIKIVFYWILIKASVLLAILLKRKFTYDGGLGVFFAYCQKLSFIWILVGTLENILYFSLGKHLLKGFLAENYFIRNGFVRVIMTGICIITFIYYFAQILQNKGSKFDLFFCVSIFAYQLTIDGTRSMQVGLVLISVSMFLLQPLKKKGEFSKKIFICIILLVITAVIINSQILVEYISSFGLSKSNGLSLSSTTRLGEWQAYWKQFLMNPVLGMGDILEGYGYDSYLNCGNSRFYMEDVGIVGSLARYGISAIFIYLDLIYHEILIIKKSAKNSDVFLFGCGILVYTVFSMINLSLLDQQRRIYFAVIIAICGYILDSIKNKEQI